MPACTRVNLSWLCQFSRIFHSLRSNGIIRSRGFGLLSSRSFEGIVDNRSDNRKIVLASGVFDLLHFGHVRFLEEAKKAGGPSAQLIVIVARDSTVQERKGVKPVMSENQRCALVASLRVVDDALLGFEKFNIGKIIEKIRPSVVAFGYDQAGIEKTVKDYVKRHGLSVRVIRIGRFGEDELDSSTKIKQKITEDFSR